MKSLTWRKEEETNGSWHGEQEDCTVKGPQVGERRRTVQRIVRIVLPSRDICGVVLEGPQC